MKTIDYRTPKQKLEDAGRFVKRKVKEGWEWVKENKELTVVIVSAATGAIAGICKFATKTVNTREAERIKQQYIYDPKLGMYWPTTRKLTGAEKLEYSRRYKDGECGGEILRQMKILKYD